MKERKKHPRNEMNEREREKNPRNEMNKRKERADASVSSTRRHQHHPPRLRGGHQARQPDQQPGLRPLRQLDAGLRQPHVQPRLRQRGGRGQVSPPRPTARDQGRRRGGRARLLHLLDDLQPDVPLPHGGRAVQGQLHHEVGALFLVTNWNFGVANWIFFVFSVFLHGKKLAPSKV